MVLKKEDLEKGIFFGGTTRLLLKKYSQGLRFSHYLIISEWKETDM